MTADPRGRRRGCASISFSVVPVKRSHSVCAQGGINGAVNTKGRGLARDPLRRHRSTAATSWRTRPPVKAMCYAAPGDHQPARPDGRDVQPDAGGPARLPPVRRHEAPPHGLRRARPRASSSSTRSTSRCAGTRSRASSASTSTGSSSGSCATRDGNCRGIVALDWYSMKIEAFPAAAVMLATGGPGIVFGRSTNSVINTGHGRRASAYQDGAPGTPTASSSRSTRRRSRAPTSCA